MIFPEWNHHDAIVLLFFPKLTLQGIPHLVSRMFISIKNGVLDEGKPELSWGWDCNTETFSNCLVRQLGL